MKLSLPPPLLIFTCMALAACKKDKNVLPSATAVASDQPISQPPPAPPQPAAPAFPTGNEAWIGIYASPQEIGGFSGTVLAIRNHPFFGLSHRMTFYSDFRASDPRLEESVKSGDAIADGDHLYVPTAMADMDRDGKIKLRSSIQKFTRLTIQGRSVLMRDDALLAFQQQNKLYDYGILIKVSDTADIADSRLSEVVHESIKVLYSDSTKGWKDPFVNGPNAR